ncbi:zinc-dependent alcohol dehydrogenase family protein [Sphingobium yanoikuyae]|uniref:NADPH:quinone reductase n=1 Tax=Sphingobium yanoikuyae TaxID=13690 RepID=A0A291MYF0_SPHYA|nr:zinc-dependent alcohol dehydrogenase family protein [Sphingobium yanoikuyae]ATI79930.1 NADPH:quinone reductase [Sphingobium yanoikuyae]
MRHVTFSQIGGPEVLKVEQFELPEVGPGEVRVQIEAIGVNRFEALYRRNFYVVPPLLPSVLGAEGVGVITHTGSQVQGHEVGDRVTILPVQTPFVGSGTYATHANVPAFALAKSIEGTSAAEEAAIWMAGLQAYNLITKLPVVQGDAVVVTAGTSPVGSALIQFAREMGATVFATTRSAARKRELEELGAHYAIATDEENLSDAVKAATDGKGARVVLDTVGGALLTQCVLSLAEGGNVFSYGAQASPDITAARVDVPLVALDRRSLSFVDLFELTEVPERFEAAKNYIRRTVTSGAFVPRIDSTYKLKDVQEAHRRMEDGSLNGKVVILID